MSPSSRKAAALQFILAYPAIASVIPGTRSVAELEENVALVEFPIPGELWADLEQDGLIAARAPAPAGAVVRSRRHRRVAGASPRICSSTWAGCLAASATRAQCFRTVPSGPIQTVHRITPFVFLPYMILSPYAPQAVMSFRSGSDRSAKGSLYFDANFVCEAAASADTPRTPSRDWTFRVWPVTLADRPANPNRRWRGAYSSRGDDEPCDERCDLREH